MAYTADHVRYWSAGRPDSPIAGDWHWYLVGLPLLGPGRRGWARVRGDVDPPSAAWVAAELTRVEPRLSENVLMGRMVGGGMLLDA